MSINILEIGPSSPSNIVLLGNAQTLRDYLLSKNLSNVPSDVINAALESEWFNGGLSITEYNVTDSLSLTNPGDVFDWTEGTSQQKLDLAYNRNLYNYNEVYFGQTFTEYRLVNIDDTAISIIGAGNVEEYYDPDEASYVLNTWNNRWEFELNRNTYAPGQIGYFYSETDSWVHSMAENVTGIQEISNTNLTLPFLSELYTINYFLSVLDNTEYDRFVYLNDIVTTFNRYGSITNWLDMITGDVIGSPDTNYFDYNEIAENTNILGTIGNINSTEDNIEDWSNTNGNPGSGDQYYETNLPAALTYLMKRNRYGRVDTGSAAPVIGVKYYKNINVLHSFNGDTFIEVGSTSINSYPQLGVNDGRSDIDVFVTDVDVNKVGGGLIEGSSVFSPRGFIAEYCYNFNLYGSNNRGVFNGETAINGITSAWSNLVRGRELPNGCDNPYISEPMDPFTYATDGADKFDFSIINPLEPLVKPQENVYVYKTGEPLETNNYGILTDINALVGNIIGTSPLPIDAILTQFGDERKDTPLGNLSRQKLASEFTFKLKQNIRKETLGKAENFAQGLGQASSTFVGSLFNNEDTASQAGNDLKNTFSDLFRDYEITKPKTAIGQVANFATSLAGINPKTDNPIKQKINWTSYIPKTSGVDDPDTIEDLTSNKLKRNKTTGYRGFVKRVVCGGGDTRGGDPSLVLLDHTSGGQKSLLLKQLDYNDYAPNYQIKNANLFEAIGDIYTKSQTRKKKKSEKLEEEINDINAEIAAKNLEIQNLDVEISKATKTHIRIKLERQQRSLIKQANRLEKKRDNKRGEQNNLDKIDYGLYPWFDNGTFNGYGDESNTLLSVKQRFYVDTNPGTSTFSYLDKDFSYGYSTIDRENGGEVFDYYDHQIDKSCCDVSRYLKDRTKGLAPEDINTDNKDGSHVNEDEEINAYATVDDLVKHGPLLSGEFEDNPNSLTEKFNNRGLNLGLDYKVGYNVYPNYEKIHAGLNRKDQYINQSSLSVLDDNGFVKISPLWIADKYEDAEIAKEIIENGSPTGKDYLELTTIHRYMFSLENLAWKGYSQFLPWWEKGPNGGRIMWFPPYDIRVTDTSSVSWGSETLIGRNEPVYTYNSTERSGVLSFKMITDFPGFYDPTVTNRVEIPSDPPNIVDESTKKIIIPPEPDRGVLNINKGTRIFVYIDSTSSGGQYVEAAKKAALSLENIITVEKNPKSGVMSKDDFDKQVFVFVDSGPYTNGDALDDGRYLSWFSAPWFQDKEQNDLTNITTRIHRSYYSENNNNQPEGQQEGCILGDIGNFAGSETYKNVVIFTISSEAANSYGFQPYNKNVSLTNNDIPEDFRKDFYDLTKTGYENFIGTSIIIKPGGQNATYFTPPNNLLNQTNVLWLSGKNKWSTLPNQTTDKSSLPVNQDSYRTILSGITATIDHGEYSSVGESISLDKKVTDYLTDRSFKIYQVLGSNGSESELSDIFLRTITKDNIIPSVDMIPSSTPIEYEEIGQIRQWLIKLAEDPASCPVVDTQDLTGTTASVIPRYYIGSKSSGSTSVNYYSQPVVDLIKTTISSGDQYDYDFLSFLLYGKNSILINKLGGNNTEAINANIDKVLGIKISTDTYLRPIEYLQRVANTTTEIQSDGTITSEGYNKLLLVFEPDSVINNPVNESVPTTESQTEIIEYNNWGLQETKKPVNELNEFYYFKKLEQDDSFLFDKFEEHIQYFDPAFHSITPVGFNNRLNFLKQCTRQGPSINNIQDDNGNILSSNSNLAFGRPPISVLRLGDFYYTRIAIETVDFSYEPLVWDINPEGIGVQPMICDVTINFKYLGGSSLSGPVTELQNAVSNNYFANVEFYNDKALKAFERYGTIDDDIVTETSETLTAVDPATETIVSPDANTDSESESETQNNTQTNKDKKEKKEERKRKKLEDNNNNLKRNRSFPFCPIGYYLITMNQSGEVPDDGLGTSHPRYCMLKSEYLNYKRGIPKNNGYFIYNLCIDYNSNTTILGNCKDNKGEQIKFVDAIGKSKVLAKNSVSGNLIVKDSRDMTYDCPNCQN